MVAKMTSKHQITLEKQWQKFEDWATKIEKGDVVFDSAKKAAKFLKKRIPPTSPSLAPMMK